MNVFYIGQQDCLRSFCVLSEMLAFRCLPPRAQSLRFRDGLVSSKRKKGHPTCAVIRGESEKSPLPGRSVPEEGASPADPVHIAWICEALADKDKALQWYQGVQETIHDDDLSQGRLSGGAWKPDNQ